MTTTPAPAKPGKLVLTITLLIECLYAAAAIWGITRWHFSWPVALLSIAALVVPTIVGKKKRYGAIVWTAGMIAAVVLDCTRGGHLGDEWTVPVCWAYLVVATLAWGTYAVAAIRLRRIEKQLPGRQILGLCGYAGAGKDTAAEGLVADGWVRVAFADKLKQVAYQLNPWIQSEVRDPSSGTVSEHYHVRLRDIVDLNGWDQAKQHPEVRAFLQNLGMVVRESFGEDTWVDAALADAPKDANLVITDVRFPNEVDRIRALGGALARVHRPGVGPVNGHVSESAIADVTPDVEFLNDSTVEDLHALAVKGADLAARWVAHQKRARRH